AASFSLVGAPRTALLPYTTLFRSSGSERMSMRRAASSTVRVIGPACASGPNGLAGNIGTRPCVGLKPTMPQKDAGIRMLPPPSVPTAHGPMPAATAAAAPPDEPPAVKIGRAHV